jgi:hypothetical protein
MPFGGEWGQIHNDPLIGIARAAQIVPELLPKEFPTPESFRTLRFEEAVDARTRASQMIDLVRRKTGKENILFLIDEAGQYVAPRQELILNLDGFARNLKELGQGKVWIVATGQQTLAEIVEKAAYNSAELNKLRDRFPIPINLDARDIREITYRRLLTKSPEAERELKEDFGRQGQALLTHTRLQGTTLFKGDPDADTFARLYPFLPQHFDLLLELIRTLARSTGGIGLRSAIRVIQDLLVDASKVLPASATKIADREIGTLACADNFFDTLRADIGKVLPHVLIGVDRVAAVFPGNVLALRVAKAIATLQPIEGFPKTPENIAALLYPKLGAQPLVDEVHNALRQLLAEKECGVVDDPQAGGFLFLSEGVKPLRDKRNSHIPTAGEVNLARNKLLETIFDPPPSAKLENRDFKAGIRNGRVPITGGDAEIQFRIETTDSANFPGRRTELLTQTNTLPEYKSSIAWLVAVPDEINDLLVEACRSDRILEMPERDADRDVAQFLRAERRNAEKSREDAKKKLTKALFDGTFIFRGRPNAVAELGATLEAGARSVLQSVAAEIFNKLRLMPVRPATDLASRFLAVERMDRMPRDFDPLTFVVTRSGKPSVSTNHPTLAEALRAFQEKLDQSGSARLQGNAVQDLFSDAPYGWSKDATRYVFAALLIAGEVEFHTPDGVIKIPGPAAQAAVKSTVAFNRIGISRRDARPSLEALDRAATDLQRMFGVDVLPLEDNISKTVRSKVPGLIERISSLPDRLRLLGLPGENRASQLVQILADLLKSDGSSATALLTGADGKIPADSAWAKAISEVLDSGAEAEFKAARSVEGDIEDLVAMFPNGGVGLVALSDAAAIRETLCSENFQESLPGLRGALRSTIDRVRNRYVEHRKAYGDALQATLRTLEGLPEWTRIAPEDREEIAARFTVAAELPQTANEGSEIRDLRLLLARESALASVRAEAEAEIRRRIPPPPLPPPSGEPESEEVVSLRELVPWDILRTQGDLEVWLSGLRSRLEELLRTNKHVRIKVG